MILSQEFFDFCKEHENIDVRELVLQVDKFPHVNIQRAAQQIKGLQIAKSKLPSWYQHTNIIYPSHLSLEQCSSEQTAEYKRSLCQSKSDTFVDLTGGFGIDTFHLSLSFEKAMYIEQQTELTEIAKHNFATLCSKDAIEVINADGVEFLKSMNKVDLIYLDPARRDIKGRKTVFIEDCTPNLLEIESLLTEKANKVMIKLSPMLDISLALKSLSNISEVHIVSVNNECKELLFVKNRNQNTEANLHCINITANTIQQFVFSREEEENTISEYTSSFGQFFYEPNASIMKAGAYKIVGDKFKLQKLNVNSHLYTSDTLINNFPGRIFKVRATSTFNKKELRTALLNISQANVAVRNFPLKAEELKKKLNLKDGGDIYIFGTTLSDNKKVIIICEKI